MNVKVLLLILSSFKEIFSEKSVDYKHLLIVKVNFQIIFTENQTMWTTSDEELLNVVLDSGKNLTRSTDGGKTQQQNPSGKHRNERRAINGA